MSIRGRFAVQLTAAALSMAGACASFVAAAAPTVGPLMQLEGPSSTLIAVGMARSSGGNFVLTWNNLTSSFTGYGPAQLQAFSADGTAVSPVLSVGSTAYGPAAVAMDKNGDFVVAWTDGGVIAGLYAQRFTAAGVAQGAKKSLGTSYTGGTSLGYYCGNGYVCGRSETTTPLQLAMDDNGDFTVGWTVSNIKTKTSINGYDGSCTATNKTYAAAYNANGVVKSYKHVINSVDALAGMTMNGAGTLAALFSTGPCVGPTADKVAYYTSSLVPTVTAQISTVIAGVNPAGVNVNAVRYGIDASGNLTVLWQADQVQNSLAFANFDATGNPVGTVQGPIGSSLQQYFTLAVAPAGNFAVGWGTENIDGDGDYLGCAQNTQLFAANGTANTNPFVVDSGLNQDNACELFSAFDGNGTLLNIWTQVNSDNSSSIVGRVVTTN